MKVYVVISDSMIHGHHSHGLHGVYLSKDDAKTMAISTIISEFTLHNYAITADDIIIDEDCGLEVHYKNDVIDIWVSCLEQDVQ